MDQSNPKSSRASHLEKTRKMAGLAILSAIIVVLQIVSNFVKFGPVNMTLALAPLIIGAAIYGKSSGAILGFVLGFVVLLSGIFGWDGGFVMMLMPQNAFATILICLVKTTVAGFVAGWVYELIAKKHPLGGIITAGILCPLINTALFVLGMVVFFMSTLEGAAGGETVLYYIIFVLAGVNFLVELAVNMVLASGITRIIAAGKNRSING